MDIFASQKLIRPLLLFGIITFLLVGFFGLGRSGMNTNSGGQMTNCPVMGATAICQMNPLEHIAAWQGMFIFTPNQNNILALLLLLLAATLWFLRMSAQYVASSLNISPLGRHYARASASFRTPLQELFSNGILHPKIF